MWFRFCLVPVAALLAMLSVPEAAPIDSLPIDQRFPEGLVGYRKLKEGPIDFAYRWPPGGRRPQRCSIRRTVEIDFLPEPGDRFLSEPLLEIPEPVVPLREYEFGFERVGDPATSDRIEAFMRLRFERLSDGKPLRVERPVIDFDGGNGTTSAWSAVPMDAEGFGGARVDIDAMEYRELYFLAGKFARTFGIVATLPELGEDRTYWIAWEEPRHDKAAFNACLCAFESKRIDDEISGHCGR